jgi:hypothetical protein
MKRVWPLLLLTSALAASARTVILEGAAIDRAAAIHEDAPRLGWAAQASRPGCFDSGNIMVTPRSSFLIRFDQSPIPKGQRITRADLIVPVLYGAGADLRFYVWRVTGEWGPGVCWQYRTVRPRTNEWARAGARGAGADRAIRPGAVVAVPRIPSDCSVNVTEDVALWQAGAAPAWGWLFTVEDPDAAVMLASPLWQGITQWKLKITYEPE